MVAKVDELVRIRGGRSGIHVTLAGAPFADLSQQLAGELDQKQAFLQGSDVVLEPGTNNLSEAQLAELQALFAGHGLELQTVLAAQEETRAAARALKLATRLAGSATDLEGNSLPSAAPAAEKPEEGPPSGALFLNETLRSGRSIYHEGPVVVVGDVNPGAEIIAGGSVVVWGRLRGMVHAGALGDGNAVICALELNPTQLRIADTIAIAPDERRTGVTPEKAAIRQGQIEARAWLPR